MANNIEAMSCWIATLDFETKSTILPLYNYVTE